MKHDHNLLRIPTWDLDNIFKFKFYNNCSFKFTLILEQRRKMDYSELKMCRPLCISKRETTHPGVMRYCPLNI